jgi:hypothetical protein
MSLRLNIAAVTVAAFALSILSTATNAGSSGSSTYCRGMVANKNLKTKEERGAEYNKCRSDPANYK